MHFQIAIFSEAYTTSVTCECIFSSVSAQIMPFHISHFIKA